MRRRSLSLCLGLLGLVACALPSAQTSSPPAPLDRLSPAPLQAGAPAVPERLQGTGLARIDADPKHPGRARLRLSLRIRPAAGFRAQAVDQSRLLKVRGQLKGPGIAEPIALSGADGSGFVAFAGERIELNFDDVPYGKLRSLSLELCDDADPAIERIRIGTAFALGPTTETLEVSLRTTPLFELISARSLATTEALAFWGSLDLNALQAFLDDLTGKNGAAPDYAYSRVHPLLVKTSVIADDLLANGGDIAELDAFDERYQIEAGQLSGTVSGLVSSDKVKIRLNDGVSPGLANRGNGAYSLGPIQPSQLAWLSPQTWLLDLSLSAGTSYSMAYSLEPAGTSSEWQTAVAPGQSLVRNLVFTPALPELDALVPAAASPGDTISLQGANFHAQADGNLVKFGEISVPAADITVVSASELEVRVPIGVSGEVPVTVAVGTQTSASASFTASAAQELGMSFASIPAGSFLIGSPEGLGHFSERPRHTVNISAFELQTTEVTQKMWWDVMGSWPGNEPSASLGAGDDYPMYNVSWCDIVGEEGDPLECEGYTDSFLKRLNENYDGTYRLPTEAEWEYAANAGSTTDFPCGNYVSFAGHETECPYTMGWYWENNVYNGATYGTKPVGQKLPNAWGLYDMHGNVAEWVHDRYSVYYYEATPENPHPRTNPTGPTEAIYDGRGMRGGAWSDDSIYTRSGARLSSGPAERWFFTGFRVVRMPE